MLIASIVPFLLPQPSHTCVINAPSSVPAAEISNVVFVFLHRPWLIPSLRMTFKIMWHFSYYPFFFFQKDSLEHSITKIEGGVLRKFNMELVFFKTAIQIGMGRFLWIPAGKQIHFIKRFSSLYWEIKEMIEFIIPLNKQFHLFLVNCTKCGLITVSRIAFHICGPKSCYCWGLWDKEIEPSCGQYKYYNPLRFNVDSINILIFSY